MAIDATFWVAISFIIFFGALIYLKVPQKITEMLDKMISDIKNEIDESEKLRTEAKTLLDNAQNKLDTAQTVSNEILDEASSKISLLTVCAVSNLFWALSSNVFASVLSFSLSSISFLISEIILSNISVIF